VSIYVESGYRFDFTAASHSVVHDKAHPHDGNTIWPGVDFRISESDRQIWVEVKSWRRRGVEAQVSFHRRMGVDALCDDIADKFMGTTCYLHWSQLGVPDTVHYVVLIEPPDHKSRALLIPFRKRMRDRFKNAQARPWGRRITYQVVDIAGFQSAFPVYPVTRDS
jgi:hypothetical protein